MKYPLNVIVAVISFLFLSLPVLVYTWIVKLEKTGCECSKDWRRSFIQFFVVFNMLVLVASIVLLFVKGVTIIDAVPVIAFCSSIFTACFVVFAIQYVHRLKSEKCVCSEDTRRNVMYIWAITQGILMIIGLLILVFTAVTLALMVRKAQSNSKKTLSK